MPSGPWGHESGPLASTSAHIHPITHVVLIVLENRDIGAVWNRSNGAGYLQYLAATYGNASSYFGVCHPSAPNYLSLTGGLPRQCGSDVYRTYNGSNLGDLLESHQFSWKGYLESMPAPCSTANAGPYVVRHDPFVYYRDVVKNSTRCAQHVLNSRQFNQSVLAGSLPNYSMYVPNLVDDCHSAPLSQCASWLQGFLGPILNSTHPATRNLVNHTVFFLTFDEGSGASHLGYNGTHGGHLWFVAISPYSRGLQYTPNASHYALLSTIEWLFHLGPCGGHDGTPMFPPMRGLFTFQSNGY